MICEGRSTAKAIAKNALVDQEQKPGDQRRLDTVLVQTTNHADLGSVKIDGRILPASYEKSECLGSGGSIVARQKLKGIDGRAPQGAEPAAQFDSTRVSLPGPDIGRNDRLIVLSRFYGWWCMAVLSWWVGLSG